MGKNQDTAGSGYEVCMSGKELSCACIQIARSRSNANTNLRSESTRDSGFKMHAYKKASLCAFVLDVLFLTLFLHCLPTLPVRIPLPPSVSQQVILSFPPPVPSVPNRPPYLPNLSYLPIYSDIDESYPTSLSYIPTLHPYPTSLHTSISLYYNQP